MLDLMRRKASGIIGWGILIFAGGALVAFFGTGDFMSCLRGYPDRIIQELPVTKQMVTNMSSEIERVRQRLAANKVDLPEAKTLDTPARNRRALEILVTREAVERLGRRLGFIFAPVEITGLIRDMARREPYHKKFLSQLPAWVDLYYLPVLTSSRKRNERRARYQLYRRSLYNLVTGGLSVSPEMVYQRYRFEHESVEVRYLILDPDRMPVMVKAAAAKKFYQANPDLFRLPARLRVSFLAFLIDDFLPPAKNPTAAEIQEFYRQHRRDLFFVPRLVKVSHIQFNLSAAPFWVEELWVRRKAEYVLALAKKIKSGREFTRLASVFAEQRGGRGAGGELGYLPPGALGDPAFARVADKLPEGQVSDLVQTRHGWHIIYKFEDRPQRFKPLAKVRAQIVRALRLQLDRERRAVAWKRAKTRAEAIWDQLPAYRNQPFAAVVKANPRYGLKVHRTGPFTPDQAKVPPLGAEPQVIRAAFRLTRNGQFSRLIKGKKGYYILRRLARVPGRPAKFDEVKKKVFRLAEKDAARQKALQTAGSLLADLRRGKKLQTLADTLKLGSPRTAVLFRTGELPSDVKGRFGSRAEAFRQAALKLFPGVRRAPRRAFGLGSGGRLVVMELVKRQAPTYKQFLAEDVKAGPILKRHRREVFQAFLKSLIAPYLSLARTRK
jgi:hypothetical protein